MFGRVGVLIRKPFVISSLKKANELDVRISSGRLFHRIGPL